MTLNELENIRNENNSTYFTAETELINQFKTFFENAEVNSIKYGIGTVINLTGKSFDNMIATIIFDNSETKKFSANIIMTVNPHINIVDESLRDVYNTLLEVHNINYEEYTNIKKYITENLISAKKQTEAEKKAELRYSNLKIKAIENFENLVNNSNNETIAKIDEFYFVLGWLANHVGTISASMPDYLESAFLSHFGSDVPHRVVDSKKRTVGGYPYQWALSFTASLPGTLEIPEYLSQYLNPIKTAITSTDFIWDLINLYGFQFGKKQNLDTIADTIPVRYIDSFYAGLAV